MWSLKVTHFHTSSPAKRIKITLMLQILGSLSKDVFERRTSTGSEAFSLFICLDANKFVLLSSLSLIKTIYLRVSTKPPLNDAKRPLPVDVRRSKTLLLKLPIYTGQLQQTSKSRSAIKGPVHGGGEKSAGKTSWGREINVCKWSATRLGLV